MQEARLPETNVPYFGAISFDGSDTNFVLPIVEIRSTQDGAEISINLVGGAQKARDLLQALLVHHESIDTLPKASSESRVTSFELFREKFLQCKRLLTENTLDKIVLANAHDFYFDRDIDAISLLSYLDQKSPHTYRFLFQMKEGEAFVGASPEQLFLRNGRRIESEAQAGTRPRGKNPSEDSSLAFELLESQKEFIEHDLVIQDIERGLSGLCVDSGWIDQRQVIKLSHVQHLRSRFGGILKPDISDSQIVQTLHPTAAVCGGPKEIAKKWIQALEDFDRGLYCGAIGMISTERTELAVGLRSALVKSRHVRIFAGAGLVSGSRAEDEWDEIDSKMRLYHNALGDPGS
jgi:menaquinone-specific isochorismate synthase